jgi:hypothetical protein
MGDIDERKICELNQVSKKEKIRLSRCETG